MQRIVANGYKFAGRETTSIDEKFRGSVVDLLLSNNKEGQLFRKQTSG